MKVYIMFGKSNTDFKICDVIQKLQVQVQVLPLPVKPWEAHLA